jgi:hypothetical protein
MKWKIVFLFFLASCSASREVVMPFRNFGYYGERLLPVKTSSSEFLFRIWINNSTSIDRVISISEDSSEGFQGYLTELGTLEKGKKTIQYYRQIKIEPKSGFEVFKNKIDSLNLLKMSTQIFLDQLPLHQPFSAYVVEFKYRNEFNSFLFDTYYPYSGEINKKYSDLEKLIFEEFDVKQYYKFQN